MKSALIWFLLHFENVFLNREKRKGVHRENWFIRWAFQYQQWEQAGQIRSFIERIPFVGRTELTLSTEQSFSKFCPPLWCIPLIKFRETLGKKEPRSLYRFYLLPMDDFFVATCAFAGCKGCKPAGVSANTWKWDVEGGPIGAGRPSASTW